jgi:hypothetical protein
MSKKSKAAVFCETQCSDEEEDEDYIDKLIKKKGPEALNSLLRDQDQIDESESEDDIIELRDSLMPQPNSLQQHLQAQPPQTNQQP